MPDTPGKARPLRSPAPFRWWVPAGLTTAAVLAALAAACLPRAAGDDRRSAGGQDQIYRFLGEARERASRPMTADEVREELTDPWADLVLKQQIYPATAKEVLEALNKYDTDPKKGLPRQTTFVVSEAGQIPADKQSKDLKRDFRFLVNRGRPGERLPDVQLRIALKPPPRPAEFMVMAWSREKHCFNYYSRKEDRRWTWNGDSSHALQQSTRGRGCFVCHVSGGPVMLEIKNPWSNWHSMAQIIEPEAIPDDSPLKQDPTYAQLFGQRLGAEDEEDVVRAGIDAWDEQRFGQAARDGKPHDLRQVLTSLFDTTTINLTSSLAESASRRKEFGFLELPLTFFVNVDGLGELSVRTASSNPPDFRHPESLYAVPESVYREVTAGFGFSLKDNAGRFQRKGETFFAFLVPEAGQEDTSALHHLVKKGIVSDRFAASVLMVDFPNPIYSAERKQLLRYVPKAGRVPGGEHDLSAAVAARIVEEAAKQPPHNGRPSPEQQFADNWQAVKDQPDRHWQGPFERRVRKYLDDVQAQLRDRSGKGFEQYVRLAVSRRREFLGQPFGVEITQRDFDLLLPETTAPEGPPLRMNEDGTVGAREGR